MNRLAWTLVIGLAVTACGGSDMDEFASSYCDLLKPCCAAAKLPADGKQCRAVFTAFAGLGTFNAAAADQCLSETRAAAKRSDFCSGAYNEIPSCDQVLAQERGNKMPGETCEDDEDCANSPEGETVCARSFGGSAQVRKCQVQVKGTEGSMPCVATVETNGTSSFFGSGSTSTDVPARGYLCHVSDGLRCNGTACVKIEMVGGMCSSSFGRECIDAAYCDTTKKMCVARKTAGAACNPFNDDECLPGSYCPNGTKVCTARVAAGAACIEDEQCTTDNCVNGKCEAEEPDFGLQIICGS